MKTIFVCMKITYYNGEKDFSIVMATKDQAKAFQWVKENTKKHGCQYEKYVVEIVNIED